MPLSSTRICPSFGLAAIAILIPVAAALGDGLDAAVDGLEAAVDGLEPPQATTSNDMSDSAPATTVVPRMHPDTDPGYRSYSGVTYAAVRPPSTRNVAPLT